MGKIQQKGEDESEIPTARPVGRRPAQPVQFSSWPCPATKIDQARRLRKNPAGYLAQHWPGTDILLGQMGSIQHRVGRPGLCGPAHRLIQDFSAHPDKQKFRPGKTRFLLSCVGPGRATGFGLSCHFDSALEHKCQLANDIYGMKSFNGRDLYLHL